jgi:hypothetical protein
MAVLWKGYTRHAHLLGFPFILVIQTYIDLRIYLKVQRKRPLTVVGSASDYEQHTVGFQSDSRDRSLATRRRLTSGRSTSTSMSYEETMHVVRKKSFTPSCSFSIVQMANLL